jgi:hypothetical protein
MQRGDANKQSLWLDETAEAAAHASPDALSGQPGNGSGRNDQSPRVASALGDGDHRLLAAQVAGADAQDRDQGESAARDGQGARKVILRLCDGERVPVGIYESERAAKEQAESLAWQLATRADFWPFFAGRFIRSQTIVSVDLLEV